MDVIIDHLKMFAFSFNFATNDMVIVKRENVCFVCHVLKLLEHNCSTLYGK